MCSLLDPSCSGSGIVNRLDYLLEDGMSAGKEFGCVGQLTSNCCSVAEPEADDVKAERLDKLASFQLQMIRHAMKCESFPISIAGLRHGRRL